MQKISIVTISKNNAVGLEKTIQSVLSQTYINIEYIIIDGASTDNSVDVITKYASSISFWISEPDSGVYNAMNKAIEKVRGEYVIFMNSGDCFASNDVISSVFYKIRDTSFIIGNHILSGSRVRRKIEIPSNLTFYNLYKNSFSHQAVFHRRDLFDKFGGYDESLKIVADWKFIILQIGLYAASVEVVNTTIAIIEANGLSGNDDAPSVIEKEKEIVMQVYFPYFYSDYLFLHKIKRVSIKNIKNHIIWRLRHFLIN